MAGCHVIGLTGADSKFALLEKLGVDRIVNYRRENLHEVLQREYPRGLDVAYDSVGGEIFDAFLDNLAMRGRLIISGHTSDFDKPIEPVAQPRIYRKLYWKSASVRAFQNPHYREFMPDGVRRILGMYYAGQLQVFVDPTPFRGLKSVPDAVDYVLGGTNVGKVVIEI
jgi:NADPH-dependent curcumin reductase CurA